MKQSGKVYYYEIIESKKATEGKPEKGFSLSPMFAKPEDLKIYQNESGRNGSMMLEIKLSAQSLAVYDSKGLLGIYSTEREVDEKVLISSQLDKKVVKSAAIQRIEDYKTYWMKCREEEFEQLKKESLA